MTHPVGLSFAQALEFMQRIGAACRTGTERVAIREARGRVLSERMAAPMSLPSFDNSAMDGFAVRGADLLLDQETQLRLIGTQFADTAQSFRVGTGECVRITTGGAMPTGADTVVIKESSRARDHDVWLQAGTPPGANVRHVGEDVRVGDPLLDAGQALSSAQLGLLAALGFAELSVARRPSVAVFTSGDELRPAGSTLAPGEIYDSNRVLLQSLLAEEGIATLSWPPLPDDAVRMETALSDASEAYDLILTCGGVSAGEKDLLPGLLAQHGAIHYWKVMMRPGMPVLFGQWGRALVLGLPGNPVSVLATFRRLALPLIDAMQGRRDRAPALRARLREPARKNHARLEFRRGSLACDGEGQLWVSPHPAAGSNQQRGAAESNALLVLAEDVRDLPAGALVDVEPYSAILRA